MKKQPIEVFGHANEIVASIAICFFWMRIAGNVAMTSTGQAGNGQK
ncbi:MAG: hypothetical protein MR866_07575 [Selenomonadaceae bacterium]|jgi:hypothetical protein|nr:hypothetical protein [Selenomonadaceae bacterium]MDD6120476.1 hypothetical protein [Selenomonadaceae bacterium]